MDEKLKEIIPILEKYEQTHLIEFYDELDENEKEDLVKQIKKTNFGFLNKLYINSFKNDVIDSKRISPIRYSSKFYLSKKDIEKYIQIGENIIKQGKLAVITLAGGMGSRLGFKGPKGSYELEMPNEEKKKSLFEFICDKLKFANEKQLPRECSNTELNSLFITVFGWTTAHSSRYAVFCIETMLK